MLKLSNLESIGKPVYKFQNNHSVDFDGVDDFIQLGEPISYTQHTISTWIKVGNNDANSTIIDARDADDDGIRLRATTDEKIIYSLNTSDLTSTNSFVDEWVHIVATYDGTTQKLYVNGSLDKSATTSQTVSVTTNAKIGARNFSDRANEFLGKIDELAIFDRALTADEVTAIFRIKYGANLVQNGNFDELGSELVTNGDFSNGQDGWSFGSDWSVVNNEAKLTGEGSLSPLNSSASLDSSKFYKLVYEIKSYTNGGLQIVANNQVLTSTVGTHSVYITGVTSIGFKRNGSLNGGITNLTIDNVSVKQVDPNDRWTLGTGWAYGDSKIVATNASGTFCTQAGILTSGKIYKVTFTIQNLTQGRVRFRDSLVNGTTRNANGTYTELITVGGTGFALQGLTDDGGFTGEVVNIMAEEQKYVATNLKLKSALFNPFTGSTLNLKNYYRMGDGILDKFSLICDMVEPSLGSELLTNGDFSTSGTVTNTSYTLGFRTPDGGISIENGVLNLVNEDNSSFDGRVNFTNGSDAAITITSGKIFALEYQILENSNSSIFGVFDGSTYIYLTNTVGTHKAHYVSNGTTAWVRNGGNNSTIKLGKLSLKQVNGVPGFMINMSESDITNDVPS